MNFNKFYKVRVEAYDSEYKNLLFLGSNGTGKSTQLLGLAANDNPGTTFAFYPTHRLAGEMRMNLQRFPNTFRMNNNRLSQFTFIGKFNTNINLKFQKQFNFPECPCNLFKENHNLFLQVQFGLFEKPYCNICPHKLDKTCFKFRNDNHIIYAIRPPLKRVKFKNDKEKEERRKRRESERSYNLIFAPQNLLTLNKETSIMGTLRKVEMLEGIIDEVPIDLLTSQTNLTRDMIHLFESFLLESKHLFSDESTCKDLITSFSSIIKIIKVDFFSPTANLEINLNLYYKIIIEIINSYSKEELEKLTSWIKEKLREKRAYKRFKTIDIFAVKIIWDTLITLIENVRSLKFKKEKFFIASTINKQSFVYTFIKSEVEKIKENIINIDKLMILSASMGKVGAKNFIKLLDLNPDETLIIDKFAHQTSFRKIHVLNSAKYGRSSIRKMDTTYWRDRDKHKLLNWCKEIIKKKSRKKILLVSCLEFQPSTLEPSFNIKYNDYNILDELIPFSQNLGVDNHWDYYGAMKGGNEHVGMQVIIIYGAYYLPANIVETMANVLNYPIKELKYLLETSLLVDAAGRSRNSNVVIYFLTNQITNFKNWKKMFPKAIIKENFEGYPKEKYNNFLEYLDKIGSCTFQEAKLFMEFTRHKTDLMLGKLVERDYIKVDKVNKSYIYRIFTDEEKIIKFINKKKNKIIIILEARNLIKKDDKHTIYLLNKMVKKKILIKITSGIGRGNLSQYKLNIKLSSCNLQ